MPVGDAVELAVWLGVEDGVEEGVAVGDVLGSRHTMLKSFTLAPAGAEPDVTLEGGQDSHDVEPATSLEYLPDSHSAHVSLVVALTAEEALPAGHAVHIDMPLDEPYVPGSHAMQDVKAVPLSGVK